MDIRKYESWLYIEIERCLDAIAAEGVEAVAAECAQAGRAGFESFLSHHEETLSGMLRMAGDEPLPPFPAVSQRHARLALIAILWRLRCALCYLLAMDAMMVWPHRALPPGELAWRAGCAADRIGGQYPDYWPYEDYPDPFAPRRPVRRQHFS